MPNTLGCRTGPTEPDTHKRPETQFQDILGAAKCMPQRSPMPLFCPSCRPLACSIIAGLQPSSRRTRKSGPERLRLLEEHHGRHRTKGRADPSMMGVGRGFQCAELASFMRHVVGRSTEWGTPACVAQVDFARACDSVRHAAVVPHIESFGIPGIHKNQVLSHECSVAQRPVRLVFHEQTCESHFACATR